jgi:hypothetical protein
MEDVDVNDVHNDEHGIGMDFGLTSEGCPERFEICSVKD